MKKYFHSPFPALFLSCYPVQLSHILDAVIKGISLGLFMAISVGPTLFAVIRYSLKMSYKAGLAFVLGVSVSDIMYVTIANVAASWLELLNSYAKYIAYGGGAILMVAGISGLLKKTAATTPEADTNAITNRHYFKIWLGGFIINTVNPGVIISWLFAVTATANTTVGYRIVLFGTCLGLILSIDFLKVFLAEAIRRKLTVKLINFLNKLSAIIILLLGAMLIITTAFNIQFRK